MNEPFELAYDLYATNGIDIKYTYIIIAVQFTARRVKLFMTYETGCV